MQPEALACCTNQTCRLRHESGPRARAIRECPSCPEYAGTKRQLPRQPTRKEAHAPNHRTNIHNARQLSSSVATQRRAKPKRTLRGEDIADEGVVKAGVKCRVSRKAPPQVIERRKSASAPAAHRENNRLFPRYAGRAQPRTQPKRSTTPPCPPVHRRLREVCLSTADARRYLPAACRQTPAQRHIPPASNRFVRTNRCATSRLALVFITCAHASHAAAAPGQRPLCVAKVARRRAGEQQCEARKNAVLRRNTGAIHQQENAA